MTDCNDDAAIVRYNYVKTEGELTGPTTRSTWRIFHEDEFWDARLLSPRSENLSEQDSSGRST